MKKYQLKPEFAEKNLFIIDLDGTVYKGDKLIPGADIAINKLIELDKTVIFLTNNASKLRTAFDIKLKGMKIKSSPNKIVSSGYIATKLLSEEYDIRTIFIIGSKDLMIMSENAGMEVINRKYNDEILYAPFLDKSIECDAILCGWDLEFTYSKIRTAMELVSRGAHFYATNSDKTYPHSKQYWPGTGVIVAALETCIGKPPEILFGKPNTFGIDFIFRTLNEKKDFFTRENTIIIGDRLETDILQANNAKIESILVETGINSINDIPQSSKTEDLKLVPTYMLSNLEDMFG